MSTYYGYGRYSVVTQSWTWCLYNTFITGCTKPLKDIMIIYRLDRCHIYNGVSAIVAGSDKDARDLRDMEVERRRRQGESTGVPAEFERYTKVGIMIEHHAYDTLFSSIHITAKNM